MRTVFQDDFDDGNRDGWNELSGTWVVQNGELHQNDGYDSNYHPVRIQHDNPISKDDRMVFELDIMQEEQFFGKNVDIYKVSEDSPERLNVSKGLVDRQGVRR